jgi:histidinol phosphatase-like enzyme
MIEAACRDHSIDLARSWMIGDKFSDLQTGFNAGIGSILVRTGYGARHEHEFDVNDDNVAGDFGDAVARIIADIQSTVGD